VSAVAAEAPGHPVRVTLDGRRWRGPGVDLRATRVGADDAVAALDPERRDPDGLRIDAPDPGPLTETLGPVDGTRGVDRSVLAAVARSRGHDAPQDDAVADIRDRLAGIDPPTVDRRDRRRRLAEATAETDRLRERVAELRGRLQERRERGGDAASLAADLDDATDRLVAAETERVAARQRLDRAREALREARDLRERRLELEDRLANRRREARAALAGRCLPGFVAALASVPAVDEGLPTDPVAAELAAYRRGRPVAPVVLAADCFADAASAAVWLGGPVLRV
jgi:hypothetical protein